MDKEVEIVVDRCGNTVVNAIGFQGVGCKSATEGLTKVLASGGVVREDRKPEFYEGGGETNLARNG